MLNPVSSLAEGARDAVRSVVAAGFLILDIILAMSKMASPAKMRSPTNPSTAAPSVDIEQVCLLVRTVDSLFAMQSERGASTARARLIKDLRRAGFSRIIDFAETQGSEFFTGEVAGFRTGKALRAVRHAKVVAALRVAGFERGAKISPATMAAARREIKARK